MSARNRTVPVLMYHHISPVDGMITTSPVNFELQLAWLARHGYRSMSSAEFAAHLGGQAAPPRSILITFDDGYLDNWVYAYPLLRKYGFSAMIFLITSLIGDGPARPHLGQGGLPETPSHRDCGQRIQAGDADSVMLRWNEVLAMRDSGVVEFHSHTHTHTRWDKSPRAAEKNQLMTRELMDSRATLEARLGSVSDHFCWPQGYFDADYVGIAHQAGFRYLYTTRAFGQNRPGSDPASIHRFAVRNTGGASLGRRVRLAANPVLGPLFNRWKRWARSQRRES
ncbi:MAG TPA: polysaccharide deacetylase family protein [Burkholderiaceae bacterium]|nr:polysaccharide deacetylase family protein [Burkholderiaceae bacterium]